MRIAALLVALLGTINSGGQPLRVAAGSPSTPIAAGEVWLVANRWGAYPGVLVAVIRNGDLQRLKTDRLPRYWNQAFNYKLLVAVSSHQVAGLGSSYQESAYDLFGWPSYLKPFPAVYVSPAIPPKGLGMNWEGTFREMGKISSNTLVLPLPSRRTIRLEYPDGRPLEGADVDVMLYGSRKNHCGVAIGIDLGPHTTSASGRISLVTTNSSLALVMHYFSEGAGGPAGTMFTAETPCVIVGTAQGIVVKRLWMLPRYEYLLRLRTSENRPIAGAHLTGCLNLDACGYGCGPLPGMASSNSSGVIRFRSPDLREMRSLTVVNDKGQKRELNESEMRGLLTRHRLRLTW